MTLQTLIEKARREGASDLHLEPGLPPTLRVRGQLKPIGEPLSATVLQRLVRDELIGGERWPRFLERRSFDLSRVLAGVRCRVNVMATMRGIGAAVRLLSSFQPTVEKLNLHPSLTDLAHRPHGLILVSGPTGSGKSSTMVALLEEVNTNRPVHILTIEDPIEYVIRPKKAFIRQREVSRHTPSFEQALRDALREDPDVLMVGELRDPESMRLTLNAAETGHLVLTTVHSSTSAEALQRLVMAFPPEIQRGVCAQLADCLVAVVSQRLAFRPDLGFRVPECEVLIANSGVKGLIRQEGFSKIPSAIEAGGSDGMWTYGRYGTWLERRTHWQRPFEGQLLAEDPLPVEPSDSPPPRVAVSPSPAPPPSSSLASPRPSAPSAPEPAEEGVIVIQDPQDTVADILTELEKG